MAITYKDICNESFDFWNIVFEAIGLCSAVIGQDGIKSNLQPSGDNNLQTHLNVTVPDLTGNEVCDKICSVF